MSHEKTIIKISKAEFKAKFKQKSQLTINKSILTKYNLYEFISDLEGDLHDLGSQVSVKSKKFNLRTKDEIMIVIKTDGQTIELQIVSL